MFKSGVAGCCRARRVGIFTTVGTRRDRVALTTRAFPASFPPASSTSKRPSTSARTDYSHSQARRQAPAASSHSPVEPQVVLQRRSLPTLFSPILSFDRTLKPRFDGRPDHARVGLAPRALVRRLCVRALRSAHRQLRLLGRRRDLGWYLGNPVPQILLGHGRRNARSEWVDVSLSQRSRFVSPWSYVGAHERQPAR